MIIHYHVPLYYYYYYYIVILKISVNFKCIYCSRQSRFCRARWSTFAVQYRKGVDVNK